MKTTQGTVQVYTGDGKGKTTAALGQAIRAMGHGQRVFIIQFMKGSRAYGEIRMARRLPNLTIAQYGRTCFVDRRNPDPRDVQLAKAGLDRARRVIQARRHDLVILDEINVAMDYGLVAVEDVLRLIREKPREVELVLTGRGAPRPIVKAADLVSEIREVKHHYRQGIPARPGVER
jgi:cob(I)alamin adenosyltransferase